MHRLPLQYNVTTRVEPSQRTLEVAVMFGLSLDGNHEHTIIPPIELPLSPGQTVLITGVSGGGKSTLLRLISEALGQTLKPDAASSPSLIEMSQLPKLPDCALVDALARPEGLSDNERPPADLKTVCQWLSRAGLSDAAVMLRRPSELSVGQRHRLALAQALAVVERREADWSVLLADEFGSCLDRTTAKGLATSVRRWVGKTRVCLLAATAHDDVLEPLNPDVLVEVAPGGHCVVHQHPLTNVS